MTSLVWVKAKADDLVAILIYYCIDYNKIIFVMSKPKKGKDDGT